MKTEKYLTLTALVFLLLSPHCVAATAKETKACSELIKLATKDHFVAEGAPPGHFHCEYSSEGNGYYVIGLHYRRSIPVAHPQSNLIGWFAINKVSGKIYQWDMANLALGEVIKR